MSFLKSGKYSRCSGNFYTCGLLLHANYVPFLLELELPDEEVVP